jgi:hypothetical protein
MSKTQLQATKGPAKLTQEQVENPVRPGFGTLGDIVPLYTNHMRMALNGDVRLWRYAINFPVEHLSKSTPEPKGKKRKRVVELLIEDHLKARLGDKKLTFASDFVSILVGFVCVVAAVGNDADFGATRSAPRNLS